MSMTLERVTPAEPIEPEPQIQPKKRVALTWQSVSFGAIMLLSAFMGFFQLDINGYSNEYYAAAVKSMLTSWSNFFFVSLDPGGFVTVDKPPVAFWIQALSAKIFGFSGVSLLLPEVLAGIAGVALLYFMIKKAFGPVAATVSALVLAVTPIFVVMNRDNNPDSILVFTLLVAAWAMLRAAETGKLRWLLVGSLMVGVAFNVKTLEAFIVLPAFYALYFFTAKAKWRTRILHLFLAGVLILVVSFSWSVAVDSIPASQRPYVGSSGNNSELSLIFGYNGLGRIDGSENGPGSTGNRSNNDSSQSGQGNQSFPGSSTGSNSSQTGSNTGFPGGNGQMSSGFPGGSSTQTGNGFPGFPGGQGFQGGPNGGNGGGGNPLSAGNPGVTRLILPDQAGQFNWFFPLAMIGLALAAYTTFRMKRSTQRTRRWQGLIVWGGWFFLVGAVFSFAQGIFHTYYLVLMAPAEAALAGIAVAILWEGFRRGNWQAWLLPIALGATAFYQAYILTAYTSWNKWLLPSLIVLGIVSIVALVIAKLSKSDRFSSLWAKIAVGVTLAGLLVTPTTWSVMTLFESITGAMPNASPSGSSDGGRPFNFGNNTSTSDWFSFIKDNLSGQIFVIIGVVAVVALVVALRRANIIRFNGLTLRRVTAIGLVALLISSSGWWYSIAQAQTTTTSSTNNRQGQQFGPGDSQEVNSTLIQYLETNQDGYKYLVAVDSSMSADSIIISTGKPVMALGGFNGSDTILTLSQLQQLIKNHTVRYFMVGGFGGGPGGGGSSSISSWVTSTCTVVNTGTSSSTTSTTNRTGGFGGQQSTVYDCSKAV